jgi:phosphate-selective porin OprO and OprP
MSNLVLVKTGITNVNNIKMIGLEGSGIMGPFSIGGEYTNSWIDPKGEGSNFNFNGWYAEAAWTITGESRIYKKGLFHRVIPNNTFSLTKSGLGAWEFAARYGQF